MAKREEGYSHRDRRIGGRFLDTHGFGRTDCRLRHRVKQQDNQPNQHKKIEGFEIQGQC